MQKSVSNLRYPCSSALKSCKLSCRAAHAVMSSEVETSTVPDNRGVDKSIVCRPLDYARGDKNAPKLLRGVKRRRGFDKLNHRFFLNLRLICVNPCSSASKPASCHSHCRSLKSQIYFPTLYCTYIGRDQLHSQSLRVSSLR